MKKIIVGLIALISFSQSFGQSPGNDTTKYIYYRFTYGNALDRYWAKKVLMHPADTTFSKDGTAILNGILYVGNGAKWNVVGSGSIGGIGSLNQVTQNGNGSQATLRVTDPGDSSIEKAVLGRSADNDHGVVFLEDGLGAVTEFHMDSIVVRGRVYYFPIGSAPDTFALKSDLPAAPSPFTATTPGIVNAPGTGNSRIFLRWDNTFWPVVIPNDTANKWVGYVYASNDSLYYCKGGTGTTTCTFFYKVVTGGASFDSTGTQGRNDWHSDGYNVAKYVQIKDSSSAYVTIKRLADSIANVKSGIKQADWTQATTTDPSYIQHKPTLGTAASNDVPASGDASNTQVVLGNDSRLTNTRTPTNGSVGNTQMASMPAHSYKGNNTGSTATPADVTTAQLAADLPAYTTTTPGVLSAPGTATGKVPFDNGTWGNIPFPSILFRYNVVDYGADTTGANATTTRRAIDSCIAAAQRSVLPAAVVFPSGNYSIDSPLINVTKALSFEGYNANLKASNSSTFNFFDIKSDSVRIKGLKFFGNTSNQTAININGFKYFDLDVCDFSSLNRGIRLANTSATFNAGNIFDCNFYSNNIGFFSDTLGEYISIFGGLFKGNTVAIQDDGGNNTYTGVNANSNTTAFKFTGGSNNSHGIIIGCNGNHNGTSFDVTGCNFGETITGGHFYEGNMSFVNSSNWRFTGGCIISPAILTVSNCANMDFSGTSVFSTYGTTRNFSGNLNKPKFAENFGDVASSITTPNGSVTPLVDSIGGYGYRSALTGDTLDLGTARWQYKSLSADDTIKKIIHPTVGRTYRLEVIANGHNFVMLDNTKVSGTFNASAALNVYNLECIDDGPDPRFIVTVSQPGVLVSRPTTNLGWGRLTGTGSISGANITKSGPDALSFTVQAVPDKVLSSGDGYYSCQAISTYANLIFGLATNPVQNDYHSINYGIYFFGSSGGANNINIAESGTLISSGLGGTNWSTNDSFRVKVTGTTVTYEKYSGGTWNVFFTSTHAVTTYPLIPQVSIRALTTFTNPKLIGNGVINNLQSYYAVQYADGINATNAGAGITAVGTFDSQTSDAKGLVISGSNIYGQSATGTNPGMINTGTQSFAGVKTFTGKTIFATPTTSIPSFNLPTGTFPTSPTDGDIGHVSGHLYFRDGSTTYDLLSALQFTAKNGLYWDNADTSIKRGGSYIQRTVITGGGNSVFEGTSGSPIDTFGVKANIILLNGSNITPGYQGALHLINDTDYTVAVGDENVIFHQTLTNNRAVVLPDASTNLNRHIRIYLKNAGGFGININSVSQIYLTGTASSTSQPVNFTSWSGDFESDGTSWYLTGYPVHN